MAPSIGERRAGAELATCGSHKGIASRSLAALCRWEEEENESVPCIARCGLKLGVGEKKRKRKRHRPCNGYATKRGRYVPSVRAPFFFLIIYAVAYCSLLCFVVFLGAAQLVPAASKGGSKTPQQALEFIVNNVDVKSPKPKTS
jgi:hypothetical protein